MRFYETMVGYYDEFFPASEAAADFLYTLTSERENGSTAGKGSSRIKALDLGCGTGGHTILLAEMGVDVLGIDADSAMVQKAESKNRKYISGKKNAPGMEHGSARFYQGNLNAPQRIRTIIESGFPGNGETTSPSDASSPFERFHLIYSLGNTIPHLDSKDRIQELLEELSTLLYRGGRICLQLLNYDYIEKNRITDLPALYSKDKKAKLLRRYAPADSKEKITFQVEIEETHGEKNDKQAQAVELLCVKPAEIRRMLSETGFGGIREFESFDGNEFTENSFVYICAAELQ